MPRPTGLAVVPFVLTMLMPVSAQWSDDEKRELVQRVDAAAVGLDPSRLPDLKAAKLEAVRAIDAAKSFFVGGSSPQRAANWLRYLDLDPLAEAIAADGDDRAVGRAAVDLSYRLIGTAPGLELSVLRRLRAANDALIDAVLLRDPDRAVKAIARQLESLSEAIEGIDRLPDADQVAAILAATDRLDAADQADELVTNLRAKFARPNLHVRIGESWVRRAVNRPVLKVRPVRDCILGTRIVGTARLTGQVTADLLPASDSVRIALTLDGQVCSNNTGYNGPVTLRTSSSGIVRASRVLQLNDSGPSFGPTTASASLNSRIDSISHPLRLVRKIARKRAARQKPRADVIARKRLRQQTADEFADETSQSDSMSVPDVLDPVRPLLGRLGLPEPLRLIRSTDQAIVVDATLSRSDQLSAPVAPVQFVDPRELMLQVHESLVANATAPVLAGRTVRQGDLARLLPTDMGLSQNAAAAKSTERTGGDERVRGDETAADEGESEKPFSVTFARSRPVIFEARDGEIRIGIRGTRFESESGSLARALQITAAYVPVRQPTGRLILVRRDDVEVDFPGTRRLSVSQAGLRGTIEEKFADVFPPVLLDRELKFPTNIKRKKLAGLPIRIERIDARDGWLSISVIP